MGHLKTDERHQLSIFCPIFPTSLASGSDPLIMVGASKENDLEKVENLDVVYSNDFEKKPFSSIKGDYKSSKYWTENALIYLTFLYFIFHCTLVLSSL